MSVYIKDIKIHNFKTYKSSKIKFTPGINVITGPNGSGKSNIIEAILFSLGERNPRRFRATAFGQLINKKTKDGYLSVTLTVTDGDRDRLFKRVITSVGKHKYYYNGKRVSRSTYLTELLKIGEEGLSFRYVPQGSVIATANMSPSELRRLIDDILGITEYNERKKRALDNLEEARRKLSEVIAKAEIIRENLSTLYDQMIRASRRKNVTDLLNRLKAAQLTIKIKDSYGKIGSLEREKDRLEARVRRLEKTIDRYESEMERIRKRIDELEAEKEEKGGREYRERLKDLMEIKKDINAVNLQIELIDTKIRNINNNIKIELSRRKDVNKRIRGLESEISKLEEEIDRLLGERERLRQVIKDKDKLLKKLLGEYSDLNEKLKKIVEGSEEKVLDALKKASIYLSSGDRYEALKDEREALEKRIEAMKGSILKMKDYIDTLSYEREEIKRRLKETKERYYELNKSIIEMEEELDRAETLYSLAEKEIVKLKTLKEVDVLFELEEDAQFLVNMARDLNVKGVLGIMSEKISGPRDILKMLNRILGSRWSSILVRGDETLKDVSEMAIRTGKRAIIIDVTSVENLEVPEDSILSLLKYPKYLDNLLRKLIGRTLIVSSIEEGLEKALQGYDVIDRKGRFYIYNNEFHIGEKWIRKKGKGRIRDLEGILKDFKDMIRIRKKDLRERIKERDELRELRIKEEESIKRINEIISTVRTNVRVLAKVLSSYTRRMRGLVSKLNELKKDLSSKEKETISIAELLAQERREVENKINAIHNEINRTKDEISDLNREIGDMNLLIKNNRRTIGKTRRLVEERYHRELEEIGGRLSDYKSELISLTEEKKDKKKLLIEYTHKEKDIEKRIQQIEEKISAINSKINELRDEERTYYNERKKVEGEKSGIEREILVIDGRINEIRLNIKRYNEIRAGLGYQGDIHIDNPKKLHKIMAALEDELREIGEVNPLAKSYYVENLEPYKQFSLRREELLKEERAILEFIDEIDRQREEILRDGLIKINSKMNRLFKLMFDDSEVNLELEDPDNIDSGLILMVKLPGKPLLPASSLSGGEKSLVLVTFLIAVNALNPNTILLLDEIDAHIDSRNLSLFTEALISERISNQLIMVSLKPTVIEIADNLIGVTIRDGQSKAISLPKSFIRVRDENE